MHSLRSVRILSGSRDSLPTSGGQGRALLQSARGPPGGAMGTAEPSGAARERRGSASGQGHGHGHDQRDSHGKRVTQRGDPALPKSLLKDKGWQEK